MSLWYDKKGKTYASKGSSSWVKYYAEHLFDTLTARLEGHYKGAEGKHKASDILAGDSGSVADVLDTKVDKIAGMGLSHQDYTAAEKKKLAGIAEGASSVGIALEPTGAEAFNDPENTANIPYAHLEGRKNHVNLKCFLILDWNEDWVMLDSVNGIEVGMPWYIFRNTPEKQERYTGYVEAISGNKITVTSGELPTSFTPSKTPSYFGTFIVNGGSIGSFEITDTAGEFSCHIEGHENEATLDAHAEGTGTKAYGYSAHAEGRKTTAAGQCSHAEGYGGSALRDGAHVEGASCTASGSYSHAEGYYTEAKERFSHAEGWETVAQGDAAHAEGRGNAAKGHYSHAEGYGTTAEGESSHAEGINNTASGNFSHAEGGRHYEVSGVYSHAEGAYNTVSGEAAHAEGKGNTSSGEASHAEGLYTQSTASSSHAEGYKTEASGTDSHAEGGSTHATAPHAHAEGQSTIASGVSSHAEGGGSVAKGVSSHAEGTWTIAESDFQHVEGKYNKEDAAGTYAHIVGNGKSSGVRSNAYTLDWEGNGRYAGDVYAREELLATKNYVDSSVAEAGGGDMLRNVYDTDRSGIVDNAERLGGQAPDYYAKQSDMDNKPITKGTGLASIMVWDDDGYQLGSTMKPLASGQGAFAANFETNASGDMSSAFGDGTTASGTMSFAIGEGSCAEGYASFAAGSNTTASNYQTVVGRLNKEVAGATGFYDSTGSAFLVGIGGSSPNGTNGFRVSYDGYCYGQNAFVASGADYAEYFEWADRNLTGEDRRGYFVTLEGNKIRKATPWDSYLLGIVSATPVIEGNSYSDQWQGMYQTDVFGQRLTETVEVPETKDERTGIVVPAHTETRFLLNPDYDPEQNYLGRNERPEWSPVGMIGQLVVIDDGSCQIDGYCKVANGGIATKSDTPTSCRVLERLDETHIRVFLK